VENQQSVHTGGGLPGQQGMMAFRLANQTYALPIKPIVRIIEMVTITPIPQLSSVVEGVINMHGVAIPVINLRRHFGLPDAAWGLRTPIIIVQIGEQTFGLIVDEVIDVLDMSADHVSRVADILPDVMSEEPIIRGVVHIEGETVLLLDVEYLLSPAHMHVLLQAMTVLPNAAVKSASMNKRAARATPESLPDTQAKDAAMGSGEGQSTMLVNGFEQGVES